MLPPQDPEQPLADRRRQRAEALGFETCRFRELIGKLGSGERTSTGLSREEAAEAMATILGGEVADDQLGAFLIAHRLRRPQPEEMAGMLEAYGSLGPRLPQSERTVIGFGVPFDGRCRDSPVLPLTALLLAAAGLAVVLQGGNPMPVKYGATTAELLHALELPLAELGWSQLEKLFAETGFGLLHQPHHFPAAETLVPTRERIGKRPPIATLELLWCCYYPPDLQVSGFVHAPTEALMGATWKLRGQDEGLTVKGLEGSADLPTSRVAIAGHWRREAQAPERLLLHARDYGLDAPEPALTNLRDWRELALAALRGEGPLAHGLVWNGGFYLWRVGACNSLEAGLARAETLVKGGHCEALRQQLQKALPIT